MADTENNSTDEQSYKQLRDEVRDYALERAESLRMAPVDAIMALIEAALLIAYDKAGPKDMPRNTKAMKDMIDRMDKVWRACPEMVGK